MQFPSSTDYYMTDGHKGRRCAGAMLSISLAACASAPGNMNGEYMISKTPNAPEAPKFKADFGDYPGGKLEYFDVYHGPITSVYSQVFWKSFNNDIPPEIVTRFEGKVMAIVGIETDQVRKTPEGIVRVPINVVYNHHHDTAVIGKGTRLDKVPVTDPRVAASDPRKRIRLSHDRVWLPHEHTPSADGYPTSAWFTDGNGGEYRKSLHMYAPPFAQLVESPTHFTGAPMHIDTWNREKMNLTGGPFVPGPYPKHALAPRSGPDAIYSGLLECPITSRIEKIYSNTSNGHIRYKPTNETIRFPNACTWPRTSLALSHNPTCTLESYVGGLSTCHHGWILLDQEQQVPWADQPLTYYKKYRVWYQEYKEVATPPTATGAPRPSHMNIVRQDWGIGADHDHSEYDVMPCKAGTPAAQCTMTISGTWVPIPPDRPPMHLVLVHHHCHAPTCLKIELWNVDTNQLLCRQEPVYGGTGRIDLPAYDERGYIATPPCLWGSPRHGLERPPLLTGVRVRVVAVTNATYGHHGEMALPEVSLVEGPLPPL